LVVFDILHHCVRYKGRKKEEEEGVDDVKKL
jgi:hypothetical protein